MPGIAGQMKISLKGIDKRPISDMLKSGGGRMKKLADAVLVIGAVVVVGAVFDLLGFSQIVPRGFGVTPGGYLKFAGVLILLNIALTLRDKK